MSSMERIPTKVPYGLPEESLTDISAATPTSPGFPLSLSTTLRTASMQRTSSSSHAERAGTAVRTANSVSATPIALQISVRSEDARPEHGALSISLAAAGLLSRMNQENSSPRTHTHTSTTLWATMQRTRCLCGSNLRRKSP